MTDLTLKALRAANMTRQVEWDPDNRIKIEFRAIELGGEFGELLNIIKKIARERIGLKGSRANHKDLEDEAADVLIALDLLCMTAGIDLAQAVREKFNATSAKHGFTTRL